MKLFHSLVERLLESDPVDGSITYQDVYDDVYDSLQWGRGDGCAFAVGTDALRTIAMLLFWRSRI